MKQRFSSLDVKVIAHELSASLLSLRVSNIYDLSSRIFLFKFAKPEHREQLLVESGYRCHLSDFARSTATAPSVFVSRLRKFLKTRRVTSVRQVGTDRVIEISFSDGLYRLLLEFYAGGNVILTDNEYNIIALLRTVSEGAEHEQFRVGSKYELEQRQNYNGVPALTKERVKDGLRKAVDKSREAEGQNKKFKRKQGDALRRALAVSITEYPPVLLDHSLQKAGFDKNVPPTDIIENDTLLDSLMLALEEARKTVEEIVRADTAKGYIISKKNPSSPADQSSTQDQQTSSSMYDDYHPFKPCQFEEKPELSIVEYNGFNRTLDEFYSSIEGQKLESKLQERELNAKRKLENARSEHEKRIDGLQQVQESNVLKAQAIEANLDRVEEARAAVNGLIAQGMDWKDVEKLIEMEQSRNNTVAQIIKLPLKLHENTATLLLAGYGAEDEDDMADESDYELSDSDEETSKNKQQPTQDSRIAVDIDLAQSAWANSRLYYDQRRVAASKQDRTVQASTKALKSTEQKINADLKKGLQQEKAVLRPVRKQLWFEKFIWFVSSDGYLVLSGKDAQQNEILYRRHLKKGDIYVHADLQGAATVIIKNDPATPDAPIPPSTLSQAGNLSVCTSSAWESKAVMSAWWVNASEVSKTATTGEYLNPGVFMVRGPKNFLPPAQLLLGFAVLFQISEDSKANHKRHRLSQPADTSEVQEGTGHQATREAHVPDEEGGDDDFPDANGEASEDDDFPDADKAYVDNQDAETKTAPVSDDDSEPDEDRNRARSNPLQPATSAAKDGSLDDVSDAEDEADGDNDSGNKFTSDVVNTEAAENSGDLTGVKHLSVAARRKMKKGRLDDGNDSSALDDDQRSIKSSQQTSKPTQTTRGKRGKAKKIAQKYADQDEEDRQLAMALLGSRKGKDDATASDTQDTGSKETAEEARARRREQHAKAQRAGLEAEELRRLNLDEGADEEDAVTEALPSLLEGLVGNPLPGDEILEAIPVCAPWNALGKYKYKVKIQPGTQKKGKAIREVLGRWVKAGQEPRKVDQHAQDTERIWPREAELLRGWKETEIVGIVPVKTLRVMMAGGGDTKKGGASGKGAKSGRGGRGKKR